MALRLLSARVMTNHRFQIVCWFLAASACSPEAAVDVGQNHRAEVVFQVPYRWPDGQPRADGGGFKGPAFFPVTTDKSKWAVGPQPQCDQTLRFAWSTQVTLPAPRVGSFLDPG